MRGDFMPFDQQMSRRVLLAGATGAAAQIAMPALIRTATAQPTNASARLRGGQTLPVPDFLVPLRASNMAARVRPHRKSGIRLESETVIETARGPRFVVHNYGHSGAGITLSWGSAKHVADVEVPKAMAAMRGTSTRPSIAVLGCGVIGLTTAAELRRKYPSVPITVYARDLDVRNTTSYVAGGQFEPSLVWRLYDRPEEQATMARLLLGTRDWIARTMASGNRLAYGIAERRNYTLELRDRNGLDYAFDRGALACTSAADTACRAAMQSGGFNRGLLPFEQLSERQGREYFTWLINPRILLPRLMADLRARSVRFVQRRFIDQQQVLGLDQTIIVNCTGYGARALFCDDDLVARRGHVVTIPNPAPDRMRWFFSGGCANHTISYVFARQTDIIVGGTVIYDDNDDRDTAAAFDAEDRRICERIMANAGAMFHRGDVLCIDPNMQMSDLISSPANRPASPSGRCAQ